MTVLRVRTKICGITRPEDALTAVDCGADAIGLVFYEPSPRSVSIDQASLICRSIPAFVQVVGLFVNSESSFVEHVCKQVPLSLLQFHGDETQAFCAGFERPYMKAIRIRTAEDYGLAEKTYPDAAAILADTYKPGVKGGTGETFDWGLLPRKRSKRLVLAGGLNPLNVRKAITDASPYAVDVSGGVEQAKGVKSPELVEQFLKEVSCGSGS